MVSMDKKLMKKHNKEYICGLIKESKVQAKKGNIVESLSILENLPKEILSPENDIGWRMTSQMAIYCHKLVHSNISSGLKSQYLSKSEMLLINWVCISNNAQLPVKEKIIKLLLQNTLNWSAYHDSRNNKALALSYLLKHLAYIETLKAKKPSTYRLMASVRCKASSLHLEFESYDQAISAAEHALSFLQKEQLLSGGKNEMDSLPIYEKCYYNIGTAQNKLGKTHAAAEAFAIASSSKWNLPGELDSLRSARKLSRQKRRSLNHGLYLKQSNNGISFVKKDDGFYNKIGSLMKISTELASKPHVLQMRFDREDKKNLSQLRLRKHHRKVGSSTRNLENIQKEIERLKERDEAAAKVSGIQKKMRNLSLRKRSHRNSNRTQLSNLVASPVSSSSRSNILSISDLFESAATETKRTHLSKCTEISDLCSLARSTINSSSIESRLL